MSAASLPSKGTVDSSDADTEREVDRLLAKAEQLADLAEKPEAGATVLIGIARLRSSNAGLDKRRTQTVETILTGPKTTGDWLAARAKEDEAK